MLSVVHTYLGLGLVLECDTALGYLKELACSLDIRQGVKPTELLPQIIEGEARRLNATQFAVPLTSGLDSRGVLGALLKVTEARNIQCYTIGASDFYECVSASRLCNKLGIKWTRIDPMEACWNLDKLVEHAAHVRKQHDAYIMADSAPVFLRLAEAIPDDAVVVSGFLGDAISGAHLRTGDNVDTNQCVKNFISFNRSVFASVLDWPSIEKRLREFIQQSKTVMTQFGTFTPNDMLDLGMRQRLRIKAEVVLPFRKYIIPYESGRWIGYWTQQAFEQRLGQQHYRAICRAGFPEVFGDLVTPRRGWKHTLKKLLPRFKPARYSFLTRFRPNLALPERGDPRRHEAMRHTVRTCLESFDKREILPKTSLTRVFEEFLASGDTLRWNKIRYAMNTEIHLRAGNLVIS